MGKQDKIIKALAYEGRVKIICMNATQLVEKARQVHDLSPTATAALGRLLIMTSMMGSDMKSKSDKLTVQLKGNGPIGMMVAVANNTPLVKGYVSNPLVDIPLSEDGKLDVSSAVGTQGFLNVIKDIGLKDPYIGISPLVSGEIAEDFAHYFMTSEQQPSAVALGVLVDQNGVKTAGGYMVVPMPDATQEDIERMEQAIFKAGAISKMLEKKQTLLEIAKQITGEEEIHIVEENKVPCYQCACNKEQMADALATIQKEELKKIIEEDGKAELVCHFCNKKYEFSKEELEAIL